MERTSRGAAGRCRAAACRPTWFVTIGALLGAAVMLLATALLVVPAIAADTAEARVGRVFWARPAITERSVEFHVDIRQRERSPVYDKTRFRIEAIEFDGSFPDPTALYRVHFDDGRKAYIPVTEFERQLYRELRRNEVAVSPSFEPPLGVGIQVYLFERRSLFEADPDVIWERVKNQGPRTFVENPPVAPTTRPGR
jgi:hypothetical protein